MISKLYIDNFVPCKVKTLLKTKFIFTGDYFTQLKIVLTNTNLFLQNTFGNNMKISKRKLMKKWS